MNHPIPPSSPGAGRTRTPFGRPARSTRGLGILAALLVLVAPLTEGSAQTVHPLPGAPYAAGVTTPAGATLAVLGGVTGEGADVGAAAAAALTALEAKLGEVGLERSHLVRVRAALAPGAGDGAEFTAWNTAWTGFFGEGGPARVTVGSSGLPGAALVTLDAVAAFPSGAEAPNARATLNPHVRLAGSESNPTAIVSTRAGLFLSAGVLSSRAGLEDPESMEQQIRSAMNRLTGSLGDHGLQWHDAFFVRVLPTPQPGRDTPDFAAWSPVYETLAGMTGGQPPPFTLWAAPGFSGNGTFIEIEVWAAPHAPLTAFAALDRERPNPLLIMTGSPTSQISAGAMIGPNPELIWISGVVAPEGTPAEEEGAVALGLMRDRVEAMGASMADVAELRVYRVEGESGFNGAYGTHFNNEENNPHKPVRTNYLVESLPGGRQVEVEAVLVVPPKQF